MAEREVIGRGSCSACGKAVQIKANKNGNAYYYCGNVDDYGDLCSHSERWGKPGTAKLRRKFQTEPETLPKPTPDAPNLRQAGTYEEYLT